MMRKVLRSGVVAVASAGVAVLAYTGVGRASGLPTVERPVDRGVPTVLAASVVAAPPVAAPPVAAPVPEPAPTTAAPTDSEAPAVEPPAPVAAAGELVVLCSLGEGGAFVPVASVDDCPGSAAVRVERAPAAG